MYTLSIAVLCRNNNFLESMNVDPNTLKAQADMIKGMSDEQLKSMAQMKGKNRVDECRNERRSCDAQTICCYDAQHESRSGEKHD